MHYGPAAHRYKGKWNGYYGGWQFTLGTWRHADALLHRHDDPQWSAPWVQLWHVWAIVTADGNWREWPNTSRACGLR